MEVTNRKGNPDKSEGFDRCQTPWYAVDPLLPYLKKNWILWESAAGEGQMATKLLLSGYNVIESDILTGQNFFKENPKKYHCQVTNPPYSVKYHWLRRSYELDDPFALLMPVYTLGSGEAQGMFDKYGIEVILLDKRVNFKMPDKGYSGGGSKFAVAWFTWKLNLGSQLVYGHINYYEDGQMRML